MQKRSLDGGNKKIGTTRRERFTSCHCELQRKKSATRSIHELTSAYAAEFQLTRAPHASIRPTRGAQQTARVHIIFNCFYYFFCR